MAAGGLNRATAAEADDGFQSRIGEDFGESPNPFRWRGLERAPGKGVHFDQIDICFEIFELSHQQAGLCVAVIDAVHEAVFNCNASSRVLLLVFQGGDNLRECESFADSH